MTQPLAEGSVLAHYRVTRRLGAGGMGEVWLADDLKLERKVALKVLPAANAAEEERRKRMVREARAAAALNHPNVAHIHEIGEADGTLFLALEFVEGETLAHKLAERRLQTAEIIDLGGQIAAALEEAHAKGITHRDIKPANIMVTPKGVVKVLDFGLAKAVREPAGPDAPTMTQTMQGVVMGTVYYMSPEQAMGQTLDWRSDLFSFGIVLYEMATGRRPFEAETPMQSMARILQYQPPGAAEVNRDVPAGLDNIVRRCLEKDPAKRYQSAAEVRTDLRLLTEGPPAPAKAGTRRSLVAAGAAAALLLVGAASYRLLTPPAAVSPQIGSIAILPLSIMSADPEMEYLASGLTESLIRSLSRLPSLKVVSYASVQRYAGGKTTLRQTASELGVESLLTGRIEQRGKSLAVSVDLVNGGDERQLWGERFSRTVDGMQDLEKELTSSVVAQLRMVLSGEDQRRLASRDTLNNEAHLLYLRARFYLSQTSPDNWKKSVQLFQEAVAKEPGYALAHAGLADAYIQASDWFLPAHEALPKAKAAIEKALASDPSLAEVHAARARVSWVLDYDWGTAEQEFQTALRLSPADAETRAWHAYFLSASGKFETALAEVRAARKADPLLPLVEVTESSIHFYSRQYQVAEAALRKVIDANPRQWTARLLLGWVLAMQDKLPEAAEQFDAAHHLVDIPATHAALAWARTRLGDRSAAQKALAGLEQHAKKSFVPDTNYAILHLALGNIPSALTSMEKAYEGRGSLMNGIRVDPRFDALRGEPRFQEILRKVTGERLPQVITPHADPPGVKVAPAAKAEPPAPAESEPDVAAPAAKKGPSPRMKAAFRRYLRMKKAGVEDVSSGAAEPVKQDLPK